MHFLPWGQTLHKKIPDAISYNLSKYYQLKIKFLLILSCNHLVDGCWNLNMHQWGLSLKKVLLLVHLLLYLSFKKQERGTLLSFYNPEQDIWNKIEKSSKTGQDKKSLIPTFAFDCYCKSLISGKEAGHKAVSTQIWVLKFEIWDFLNISLFNKILSLKSFSNLWGNLYTKCAILDIMFHFACP